MLINNDTVLVGKKVILIPYKRKHVKKYHNWMKDEEILKLTASEPLSLEEECEMQQKWQKDIDKLTFIILDGSFSDISDRVSEEEKEISAMVGDINIFLTDPSRNDCAEIEVMIAEKQAQRKGFGLESLRIMMSYCNINLKIKTFTAKIGMTNAPSLQLFQQKLGFKEQSKSEIFQELTLIKQFSNTDLIPLTKNKNNSLNLGNVPPTIA